MRTDRITGRAPRFGLAVARACCALIALAGCGSSARITTTSTGVSGPHIESTPRYVEAKPSEPVRGGTVNVAYREITIHPDVIRVKVGTIVKWTNYDTVEHNVTSESGPQRFAAGDFGGGGTYEVKLTRPGVIHYECTIHPATMNGTIEVLR